MLQKSVVVDELQKVICEVQQATQADCGDPDLRRFLSFDESDDLEQIHADEAAVPHENEGFQCMKPHTGQDAKDNPNRKTIDILQKMASYYDRTNDEWRTVAYRKAISALSKQTTLISTKEQALSIRGIGGRLADKVEEIVTTNRLARLESTLQDPSDKALHLFMGIYGVGHQQARVWVSQGHRSLDDLRTHAKLNSNQQTGIDHYEDFLQRIPRAEVAKHGAVVQKALKKFDATYEAIVMGSYRRGNADSGDIDIIITSSNDATTLEQIHDLTFNKLVPRLMDDGFLKCALASSSRFTPRTAARLGGSTARPRAARNAPTSSARSAAGASPPPRVRSLTPPTKRP